MPENVMTFGQPAAVDGVDRGGQLSDTLGVILVVVQPFDEAVAAGDGADQAVLLQRRPGFRRHQLDRFQAQGRGGGAPVRRPSWD